jgi:hypothetical protein
VIEQGFIQQHPENPVNPVKKEVEGSIKIYGESKLTLIRGE